MKRFVILLTFLLLLGGPALAQEKSNKDADDHAAEKKVEEKKPTPVQQLRAMSRKHRKAIGELKTAFRKAESEAEIQKIIDERRAIELELAKETIELVKLSSSEIANVEALAFMARYNKGEGQTVAANYLLENFIESKRIENWIRGISRSRSPSVNTDRWLRTIMEKSPHEKVKGQAAFTLMEYYQQLAELPARSRKSLAKSMGEQGEAFFEKWTAEKCTEEMESFAKLCVEEFGDVKLGRSTIGRQANLILKAAKIKVGNEAPEIVGLDLDGQEFKLTDYRGKVVMLDFWGDW